MFSNLYVSYMLWFEQEYACLHISSKPVDMPGDGPQKPQTPIDSVKTSDDGQPKHESRFEKTTTDRRGIVRRTRRMQ